MKEIFTMDLKGKLLIAVVFMVLGFMLSVQYKTTELQRNVRMDRVEDLSERLKVMEAENKQLREALENIVIWAKGSTCEICGVKEMVDTDAYDIAREALKMAGKEGK